MCGTLRHLSRPPPADFRSSNLSITSDLSAKLNGLPQDSNGLSTSHLLNVLVHDIIISVPHLPNFSQLHSLITSPSCLLSSSDSSRISSYSGSTRSSFSSPQPTSTMHNKLTTQMQCQQNRFRDWQDRQLETFTTATRHAAQNPESREAYESKRSHPHLDKVTSTLRRLRG